MVAYRFRKGWNISGALSSFLVWWQRSRWKHRALCAVIHQCRTKISKNKSTLIYQLCSASPPVNFFADHSGYNLSHEQRVHVENVLQIADGVEQCIVLLCTIVYCSEPPKPYWDTVCLKTLSPGLLSCRNATCGFKIAEPRDREIQQHPLRSAWNLRWTTYAPKAGCTNLTLQELQECQGLQVQLALLLFACNQFTCLHFSSLNFTWLRLRSLHCVVSRGISLRP